MNITNKHNDQLYYDRFGTMGKHGTLIDEIVQSQCTFVHYVYNEGTRLFELCGLRIS